MSVFSGSSDSVHVMSKRERLEAAAVRHLAMEAKTDSKKNRAKKVFLGKNILILTFRNIKFWKFLTSVFYLFCKKFLQI